MFLAPRARAILPGLIGKHFPFPGRRKEHADFFGGKA